MMGTGQQLRPGRMLTSDLLLGLDGMALLLFPQPGAGMTGCSPSPLSSLFLFLRKVASFP